MAGPAQAAPPEPTAAPQKPPAKPKRTGVRPDYSTLLGLAIALSGILGGLILEKGKIQDVSQATAAMIVLGGTLGAVMVTMPLPVVLRAFRGLKNVFLEPASSTSMIAEQLILFATKARKSGIVSLETDAASIADPFFKKALNLAIDGTDLQELRKMMEIDIAVSEQAAETEAKVWESAGGYSPTIGIIGAVMGLIQVMKHLEDIKEVGHGIAVAFVATVYGVGAANLFLLPAANKLRGRLRDAVMVKEMTLEGVIGILEGLNPTLIRLKLEAFDQHSRKPAPAKAGKPAKGEKGPQPVPSGGKA
ncbi:MAG TPA: flagellar motor protein [Candidatus Sulfopaludibacter sp.]|jgi:chemotaxis protein MotA|nr:flagellar motor protein [Candidatus Sulfopaludibacter sp.]